MIHTFVFVEHPLATGFPITSGAVNVTVPDVVDRDDYIVIREFSSLIRWRLEIHLTCDTVFGDSGNTSPKFTITH